MDSTNILHSENSHIDTILFDLGSTLIYFEGDWDEVILEGNLKLVRFLTAAGFQFDETSFLQRFRAELQAYFTERETEFIEHTSGYILRLVLAEYGYPSVSDELIRNALRVMYSVSQAYWKPEADTHILLDLLNANGYSLGLISNASDDDDVQSLIDQANMRQYFKTIVTSAAQGIRKPNPQIFYTALADLGAQPKQALMVGDTLGADILGAHNAGVRSVWVTRRADTPANRAHSDTIHPDVTIATLSELPGVLAHLNNA